MYFLEEYVVNNSEVSRKHKTALFARPKMKVYHFMGVLTSFDKLDDALNTAKKLTDDDK